MLCQVFGKVPGTKQPSGEYTNRFHGNSYVPNTRQGEERLPWDHTHQKVVFPVYELRMYAENHAHEGHCRCEEYCMRIAARENYHRFAPHGGGAFSGKDATKVDRSGAYMARYIAKNMVAAHLADRCQVTLAYAIGEKDPVMVDVNTFGTGGPCEDDCLSAAVRKAYDLTPAGIIKQLNLLNPMYSRTAAGGHFGREDFPWENIEHMSDLAAYIV